MTAHALFIGVNQYADRNIRPLVCAQRDASELYHLFKRDLGYGDNAHLLETPRVEDVHDQLEAIGQRARAGDTFFLYFAGHGYEPTDGADQYLLLSGARLVLLQQASGGAPSGTLSVKDLITLTDGWPDVGRVFVFDACRAELMPTHSLQGVPVFGSDQVLQRLVDRGGFRVGSKQANTANAKPAHARPAPVIIKACQGGQLATELLEHGRSVFAKALDDALNSARQAGQAVLADRGLLQAVSQRMAGLCSGIGSRQVPWMSEGAPEVLLYMPPQASQASPAPPTKETTPVPTPAAAAAPSPGPQLAQLFEDFERQLKARHLQAPVADCCVATLALMRAAGLGEAGLARYEQALSAAVDSLQPTLSPAPMQPTLPEVAIPTRSQGPAITLAAQATRPGPPRWHLGLATTVTILGLAVAFVPALLDEKKEAARDKSEPLAKRDPGSPGLTIAPATKGTPAAGTNPALLAPEDSGVATRKGQATVAGTPRAATAQPSFDPSTWLRQVRPEDSDRITNAVQRALQINQRLALAYASGGGGRFYDDVGDIKSLADLDRLLRARRLPITADELLAYRRIRKVNVGELGVFAYPNFAATLQSASNHILLRKTTGSQRINGKLYRIDDDSFAFLGAWSVNDDPIKAYGSEASVAAYLYKVTDRQVVMIEVSDTSYDMHILSR